MERRAFLAACAAALLPIPAPEPVAYRRFFVFDRPGNRWVPIAFEDIRAGMEVWMCDPTPGCSDVCRVSEGTEGRDFFRYDYRIDPQTNRWVYS